MLHGHGGNIHILARRLGCAPQTILDMSSNVNPYGPPPGLLSHLAQRLARITALPPPDAAAAVTAFSTCHGLDPARVLAGNGTTQLIHALPGALGLKKAVVAGPTYADYADACRQWGTRVQTVLADGLKGFLPDIDLLQAAARKAEGFFICNPNNPTGVLLPAAAILSLADAHPACWFVVDESYLPFVPNGEEQSLLTTVRPNLIVLHSMSKIFRIPGLRIGFMSGPPVAIRRMERLALPWSVNALAQEAVCHLMERPEETARFIETSRAMLTSGRRTFLAMLRHTPLLEPVPGVTPFILFRLREPLCAATVCDHLARERILIRDCANFTGLSDRFIRISLKKPAINRRAARHLMDLSTLATGPGLPPI